MYGLFGKFLDVNLKKNQLRDYPISEEVAKKHLGGRGLGARILLDEFKGGDAFSSNNLVVYATGPVNGLYVAGSSRFGILTKSPLSGFLGETYSGGFFSTELKQSGYDGIIIREKADHPKYLLMADGEVELKDADPIWGKPVKETEDFLRETHGKVHVSCIGPAGENLVKYAAIINDRNRATGRCGTGAVLGSKKLKAIAAKGHREVPVYDKEAYKEARRKFTKSLNLQMGKYGTTNAPRALSESGILPTQNFRRGIFEGAEALSGAYWPEGLLVGRDNCTACPIRCKRKTKATIIGEEVIPEYGGPEYETLAAMGSLLMIDNPTFVSLANQKCNAYGLDTISTGNVIAWFMEATEKGIVDRGIEWGDMKGVSQLIDQIAAREGIGNILAEGVKRASKSLGGEEFAVHVKGTEVAMHEPRGKKALGISYATSPRGGIHTEGMHDTLIEKDDVAPELGVGIGLSRFTFEGKIPVLKNFEEARSFVNSVVLCAFTTAQTGPGYNLGEVREVVNAVTGYQIDRDEMLLIGERNYNLCRLFSVQQGVTPSDDDLPRRFKEETLPFADREEQIPQDTLDQTMQEYFRARGWDENGVPTKEHLKKLGI